MIIAAWRLKMNTFVINAESAVFLVFTHRILDCHVGLHETMAKCLSSFA